jgi:hypothetical protein
MSPLIPRRRHRTLARKKTALCVRYDDADFVHKIGTRPPQISLRGYLCVHLRYNLVIRVASFQITLSSRLACSRYQLHTDSSLRGYRVLPRSGRWRGTPPRRTRIEWEQFSLALISVAEIFP